MTCHAWILVHALSFLYTALPLGGALQVGGAPSDTVDEGVATDQVAAREPQMPEVSGVDPETLVSLQHVRSSPRSQTQPYPLHWLRTNRRASAANPATVHSACGKRWCNNLIRTLKTVLAQEMLDQAHLKGVVPLQHYAVVDEKCEAVLRNVSFIQEAGVTIIGMDKVAVPDGIGFGQQFSLCAATRLFAPSFIPTKRIIYMDTDTFVVRSIRPVIDIMKRNPNTPMFMVQEVEDRNCMPDDCGWYGKFVHHWFRAGQAGYNSGTLAVNVNAWKDKHVERHVSDMMQEAGEAEWGFELADQDLLNMLAAHDSRLLGTLPCEFNQRTDSRCFDVPLQNRTAKADNRFMKSNGNASAAWYRQPAILHANRKMFERQKQWEAAAAKIENASDMVLQYGASTTDPADLLKLAGVDATHFWWKPCRK